MKIVIVGSNGFLGSNVDYSDLGGFEYLKVSRSRGLDIRSDKTKAVILDFFPDIIVNFAAQVGVLSFNNSDSNSALNLNNDITMRVCEIALSCEASLIHLSSYVYGPPVYLPVDENHSTSPNSLYALSKLTSENIVKYFHDNYSLPAVVLRPFNIFGNGQSDNFLLPNLIKQFKQGGEVCLNSFDNRRDHLWVGDLVNCILEIASTGVRGYEIYNVGSGCSVSNYEIAEYISRDHNNPKIIDGGVVRQGDVADCYACIKKLQSRISWTPTINIFNYIDTLQ